MKFGREVEYVEVYVSPASYIISRQSYKVINTSIHLIKLIIVLSNLISSSSERKKKHNYSKLQMIIHLNYKKHKLMSIYFIDVTYYTFKSMETPKKIPLY